MLVTLNHGNTSGRLTIFESQIFSDQSGVMTKRVDSQSFFQENNEKSDGDSDLDHIIVAPVNLRKKMIHVCLPFDSRVQSKGAPHELMFLETFRKLAHLFHS